MKTILFSLLVGILICTLPSCKESNPAGPEGGQLIIPLRIGNTWSMRYTVYDSTGSTRGTIDDTFKVVTDTVVAGDTWYTISSTIFSTLYFANRSDGIWTLGTSTEPSLIFKYPANVGETWNAQVDPSTTFQISLQSDTVSVTVPKGTYTCYEYRLLENSRPYLDLYASPGVGFVAMDIYANTDSGRSYKQARGELISFVLM
jgi:hypothetical protein